MDTKSSSSSGNNDDEISTQQPFEVTFQDPIFTPADERFLTEHLPSFLSISSPVTVEVSVVKHPEAFSRIDGGTFLFAPHLEVGVFARALEGNGREGEEEGPVCCIGSDIDSYVDG